MFIKKIVALVAITLLPLMGAAQSPFDQFNDMDDVINKSYDGKTLMMFAKAMRANNSAVKTKDKVNNLERVKKVSHYITKNHKISKLIIQTLKEYVKSSSLEEVGVSGSGVVKCYVKRGKDKYHVDELLELSTANDYSSEAQYITLKHIIGDDMALGNKIPMVNVGLPKSLK